MIEAASLRDAQAAWDAAQYVAYAFHQPNKMPERPSTAVKGNTSSEADRAYARAWMKAMHNQSRGRHGS